MFVRQKRQRGRLSTLVQVCESIREGKKVSLHVLRHIGAAKSDGELHDLLALAEIAKKDLESQSSSLKKSRIKNERETPSSVQQQDTLISLKNPSEIRRIIEGPRDVFGALFDALHLDEFLKKNVREVLKEIVVLRISTPTSKRKASWLLFEDYGVKISLRRIYRMMDSVMQWERFIKEKIYEHTKTLGPKTVDVLFFDVTTLYFESILEDEIRHFGYSKDNKYYNTQVTLALATTSEGLPVGYQLFPGNTGEISTLLQCLDKWQQDFKINKVCVVADRGMMSESNLIELEKRGITYVVAAKLKKLPKSIQEDILSRNEEKALFFRSEEIHVQERAIGQRRLIVSYSPKRARKDLEDRERLLKKLEKKIGPNGGSHKKLIGNRGYLTYMKEEGVSKVFISQENIAQAARWDGLHGVITNDTQLSHLELFSLYARLWVVEESFRLQKHDIEIRPVFHFKPQRVRAHILICYLSFALCRYLQHHLKLLTHTDSTSIETIRSELLHVQASLLKDTEGRYYRLPSPMSQYAKRLYSILGVTREGRVTKIA